MTAAPTQLRLPPPPGFCRAEHCTNRVSVVNTDGVCDACTDEKARLRRHRGPLGTAHRVRLIGVCSRCGVEPNDLGDAYCAACRKAYNAKWRSDRPKRRKPLNLPCACCGKAARVKDTSYCAACAGEYQAKRQKRRAGQGVTA